jgi:hypothetical protein
MTTPSRFLLASVALLVVGCDPTATRLSPTRLEFLFAAHTRSFDLQGNLLLTGYGTPRLVRLDRQKLEFQDFSQGLPEGISPSGELLADAQGNLAAGGWYRGASDAQWTKLPELPSLARVFTFHGAGTVSAVVSGAQGLELHRLEPPAGAWALVGSLPDIADLESSTFKARQDGTLFIGQYAWVPGAAAAVPLLACPTVRIDQACEGGFEVFTHPRRNDTYLVSQPFPGVKTGKLFRVPEGASFPLDYDALKAIDFPAGRWTPVRVSSDGVLHVAWLQTVSLDYPPYEADEATLYAVDAGGVRAEARLLWSASRPVVGDHRDLYQASAQLAGSVWVPDPVYVWKF